ncbi:hypothetical protein BDR03DRAFT_987803 [Suillus americanus]|nr:hypothetical protein BDR03DRAFT_987803 [Suillus americanus]
MSHLSVQMSGDDSDDDWDEGNVSNLISIIPWPNTSKGDLMDALKAMQLEIQRLCDDNRTLKENNKQSISLYARKYGMMVEMFPDSELLMKKCPGPNLVIQPTNMEESASRAAVHANNQLNTNVEAAAPNDGEETDVVSGLREQGRGKTRGKKAATQGPTHRGCSGVKVT